MRIAARGVIFKDDRLFGVRLKPYNSPVPQDFWCLPGGKLDPGENISDCARRELIEELGVEPVVGGLLYVQQFMDGEQLVIEFLFHITNADDYAHVDLSATTHGETEIAEYGFVERAAVNFLPEFLRHADIGADIASGKTQIFDNL